MATDIRPYPPTSWTLIERAAAGHQESLAKFFILYQPPLRAHLLGKWRMTVHDAEDSLQGFIADKIIARTILAQAKRIDGPQFRAYLRVALDRYVVSQWRKSHAVRRNPVSGQQVPFDESMDLPGDGTPASDAFDLEWAKQVMQQAVDRYREECARKPEQARTWRAFDARILDPVMSQTTPPSYAELVSQFGFESPSEASNAVVTGRRLLERCLRAVVREYTSESRVEDEIAELTKILFR